MRKISINIWTSKHQIPCPISSHVLSFVLVNVFMCQRHKKPIYKRSYGWPPHEHIFDKIDIETNLEAFLGAFWSQYWIILTVSNDGCFCKFIYMHVCFSNYFI